ncbi:MAG: PAS domain-containing protein [Tagaea sp.]|nr:PAS domain-containing protein [Tagaea sp.]
MAPPDPALSEESARRPRALVAIGASAGGLEALRALVANVPEDSGFAFVVAQHLAPQHASMLTALLARESRIAIEEARDGVSLARDTIYITPPNRDVVVKDGRVVLQPPHTDRGPKPSVNLLFESLARERGREAIAIVLSGTGSDGATGVRAIKAAGGVAVAQDEATAKYNGMPQAAIETGLIDAILPPDKIGAELVRVFESPRKFAPVPPPAETLGAIDAIFALLNERHGIDLKNYKPGTVGRRVESRVAANRLNDAEEYLELVRRDPAELDKLANAMMISVTSFFRDPEAFDALGDALDAYIAGDEGKGPLRVWVPGCATGEEAYSIAIACVEAQTRAKIRRKVQIFGTDLDEDAIARGRRGVYSYDALAGVDSELVRKYFDDQGDSYQVTKDVRERVVFAKHDLLRHPPFLRIDLISCRNLLIYFKPEINAQVISLFHRALKLGGLLLLGKSETLGPNAEMFDATDRRAKLFRRRNVASDTDGFPQVSPFAAATIRNPRVDVPPRASTQTLIEKALADAFGPRSVLIDENLVLLQAHGDVGRVLQFGAGKPDLSIASFVPRGLGTTIRSLVHKAKREGGPVETLDVDPEGGAAMRVCVRPVRVPGENWRLYLLSFLEPPPRAVELGAAERGDDRGDRLVTLEHELTATREHLQTVAEELETANEELQSANEELQSANEELQSTNEELETSNEELQSTNEELQTLNEELEQKTSELHEANTDLLNIQDSIGAPMVVLDRTGRVRRYNRTAGEIFQLATVEAADGLARLRAVLDADDLDARVENVVARGRAFERQVALAGREYQLSIAPNVDSDGAVLGAILFFFENTESVRMQRSLREREAELTTLAAVRSATLDGVPAHVALVDGAGRVLSTNKAWDEFARRNGFSGIEFGRGVNYIEVCRSASGDCAEEAHDVADGLARVLSGELEEFTIEYPCHSPTQERWFKCVCLPVVHEGTRAAVISHIDISERKLAELSLRAAEQRARDEASLRARFLADISRDMRAPLDSILGVSEMIGSETRGSEGSDAARRHATDIHESAEHLLDFIARFIELGAVDPGPGLLREAEADPGGIARAAVRMLELDATKRGHRLSAAIARDLPRLRCDPGLVRQMMINLIGNAVRFSPVDSLVTLSAVERKGRVEFQVRDGGPGFSADEVLKRKRRAGANGGEGGEPAGRNLALVQTLAKLHGAELKLTSRIGEGTVATVSFPPERTLAAKAPAADD